MNFSKLRPDGSVTQKDKINFIRSGIAHVTDGPITPFVLISRAMRMASDRRAFNSEDVANALHEELSERGWIVDDEDADVDESGS